MAWFEAGVPLAVALAAIGELFDELEDSTKILTLKSCNRRVLRRWRELGVLAAVPLPPTAPASSSGLEALAASLPTDLPDRERWASEILQTPTDADAVATEERLQQLDRRMLEELLATLPEASRAAIATKAESALARLGRALDVSAAAEARTALIEQEVRRRFGAPRLSLVS